MSYENIGQDAWKKLPNVFSNKELAATLTGPTSYRSWVKESVYLGKERAYIKERTNSNKTFVAQHRGNVITEYGVSYSPLNGMFTKWVRHAEMRYP